MARGSMKRFILIIFVIIGVATLHQSSAHAAGTYAALGDSVAAGAGLPSEDTVCKRSPQAYPFTVAQTTGLSLQHYACSGAKADEGIYGNQQVGSAEVTAQLNQAFASGKPSLITITIGANDARWTQFIRQCYYIRCGYGVDTARFAAYLVDLKIELNVIMAKISTLSRGVPPRVILTGYYNPLSSSKCANTEGLTSNEVSWLKNRTRSLNSAISSVASRYSYARYASVNFTGHELCSSDPWVQGLSDPLPFHPTVAGQRAIAQSVTTKYTPSSQSSTPRSSREKLIDWYARHRQ